MKTLLLFALTFIPLSSSAQQYDPFNTQKRFQNPNAVGDDTYYFYPIDTLINSDTIRYSQYLKVGSSNTSVPNTNECSVWGDPNLVASADTSWLGRYIWVNTNTNELFIKNGMGETLAFDFGISIGDSAIFYQNTAEAYYMKYDQINEETHFGVDDSVKTFVIAKYDLVGNPLISNLTNFELKLGKELGLLSFMDCNNFPLLETEVELMGQLHPNLGEYNMTYDELYPWDVGDSLLVKGTQPFLTSYKLITVTDRVESTDSVWIYLNFEGDLTGFNIEYPNVIQYHKGENFSETPNISFVNGYNEYNDIEMNCGSRKRHRKEYTPKYYCDTFHCFPDYDAVGSLFQTYTYFAGLGMTNRESTYFSPTGGTASATLIYSRIGGVVCGTPESLSLVEEELEVSLSPNPAKDEVIIQTDFEMERVSVLDGTGKVSISFESKGFTQQIETSELSRGIYFVLVESSDGRITRSKLILE